MSPRNQQGKKSKKKKIRNEGIEGSGVAKGLKHRKHESKPIRIRAPPSSPKSEKQSSSPQKSPVQSMGVVDKKDSMPASLNKRPHKRQEVTKNTVASELHEKSTKSNVDEEEEGAKDVFTSGPLPYVEVKLPDGRLIRQCRASDVCPLAESFIEKRARMENHLREKHGINVKIPNRPAGRPTNENMKSRPCRTFPHPHAESWKRQAEKRSLDKDGKFERNRCTYERIQSLRAEEAWNELKHEFKTTTKDNYIASWVKDKMSKYMSTATERVAKIEKRMQARGKTKVIDVPAWLHVVMDDLDQQEKEDKVDQQQEKQGDQQKETNEDDQHLVYDETLRKFDDMDIGKERERSTMSNETILAQDEVVKGKKKKLPIRSSRKTQGRNDTAPIIVSSPLSSEESNMLRLTFQISNGSIVVIEKGKGRCTTRGNIAKLRLSSRIEMEFISTRSYLMVDVSEELVKKILDDQASTATLNLFGIWMENTLPNDILEQVLFVDGMWSCMPPKVRGPFMQRFFSNFDVSKATLIFLPIILRNHWSLFAFCHNKHKKSLGFKGKNSFLLYFDSMGLNLKRFYTVSLRALHIM